MENVTIMKRFRCSLLVKANSAVYVQLNIFAYVTATARLEILSHIFQMFLQVLFFFFQQFVNIQQSLAWSSKDFCMQYSLIWKHCYANDCFSFGSHISFSKTTLG